MKARVQTLFAASETKCIVVGDEFVAHDEGGYEAEREVSRPKCTCDMKLSVVSISVGTSNPRNSAGDGKDDKSSVLCFLGEVVLSGNLWEGDDSARLRSDVLLHLCDQSGCRDEEGLVPGEKDFLIYGGVWELDAIEERDRVDATEAPSEMS